MRELILIYTEWRPTFRFAALALHEDGSEIDVSTHPETRWSCSDPSLLRFDDASTGTVHGIGEGRVTISAEYAGARASYELLCGPGSVTVNHPLNIDGHNFLMLGVARDLNLPFDFKPNELRISPPGAAELLIGNGGRRYIRANRLEPVTVTARSGDQVLERTFAVRDLPITFRGEMLYERPPRVSGAFLVFIGEEVTPNPVIEAGGRYMIDPPFNLHGTSSAPEVLEVEYSDGVLERLRARAPGESLVRLSCYRTHVEFQVLVVERPHIEWF